MFSSRFAFLYSSDVTADGIITVIDRALEMKLGSLRREEKYENLNSLARRFHREVFGREQRDISS